MYLGIAVAYVMQQQLKVHYPYVLFACNLFAFTSRLNLPIV